MYRKKRSVGSPKSPPSDNFLYFIRCKSLNTLKLQLSGATVADKANITKKDLVEEISARTGLTQAATKVAVESFLDSLVSRLIEGNNIEIRGFGRFKLKKRNVRTARNPRTGEEVIVKAGTKPVFEASKDLLKSVNTVIEVPATAETVPVENDG